MEQPSASNRCPLLAPLPSRAGQSSNPWLSPSFTLCQNASWLTQRNGPWKRPVFPILLLYNCFSSSRIGHPQNRPPVLAWIVSILKQNSLTKGRPFPQFSALPSLLTLSGSLLPRPGHGSPHGSVLPHDSEWPIPSL